MDYIKGMSLALLLPMLVDWVLVCEIKRQKSKNINGTVTRLMRECLIKIYCAIGELQSQKESTESGKLKKQLDEMKKNMDELYEENRNLRKELEEVKKSISISATSTLQEKEKEVQTPVNSMKENRRAPKKDDKSGKNLEEGKRNLAMAQPAVTPLEKRNKTPKPRREFSYPLEVRRHSAMEEEAQVKNLEVRKEGTGKKKRLNSVNSTGKGSSKKRSETEKKMDKGKDTPEVWTRVIGRKERKQNNREEANRGNERNQEKRKMRKKRPFKTSAVVITTGDRGTSYSEVLAWARQSVKLNEDEMNSLSTKRSATGVILLEIKGDKNEQMTEKLAESLRATLGENSVMSEYIGRNKWLR